MTTTIEIPCAVKKRNLLNTYCLHTKAKNNNLLELFENQGTIDQTVMYPLYIREIELLGCLTNVTHRRKKIHPCLKK